MSSMLSYGGGGRETAVQRVHGRFSELSYLLPVLRVRPEMLRQMVRSHELLRALRALEPLLAGVSSSMPLQLVRPGEALAAEHPVADERPLARVPAEMGSKMRSLAVHLVTAGDVADVLFLPVGAAIRHDAVGTRARDPPHPRLDFRVAVVHVDVDIHGRLTRRRLERHRRRRHTNRGRRCRGFSIT